MMNRLDEVPENEWRIYQRVIDEARASGIGVAVGGAFALAVYTGELRNTKDFDLYLLPEDRHAMIEAMSRAGLTDFYERQPYDRAWIYRGVRDESMVDAIWAMANLRAVVDEGWLTRGTTAEIRGESLRVIPVEELIWSKLYVLQRSRCDWGDVLNLLDACLPTLDWPRLLARLGLDTPLLAGVLSVFTWLEPHRSAEIPGEVWDRLHAHPGTGDGRDLSRARADLLDSRPWFRGTNAAG
ncbi:MAG: hypothetical protein H0T44_11945 [Gemmatimonadales bacterium]|nr:hypothetical protein [Gemmatimonadales bacterium]